MATKLSYIDAETCSYDELFNFCERMRFVKAKESILDPKQQHKVGFWYGDRFPLWVCKKNGRDFNKLLEVYVKNSRKLGLPSDRFHTFNEQVEEIREEFNRRLVELITDDLMIDHEMECDWSKIDELPF